MAAPWSDRSCSVACPPSTTIDRALISAAGAAITVSPAGISSVSTAITSGPVIGPPLTAAWRTSVSVARSAIATYPPTGLTDAISAASGSEAISESALASSAVQSGCQAAAVCCPGLIARPPRGTAAAG